MPFAFLWLGRIFTPSNPLFRAAYNGDMYVVQNYISEGKDINALDKWNNTALHWAAKGSQYRLMRLLVDNGIDVNAVNEQGENALHWSVFSNNVLLLIVQFSLENSHRVSGDAVHWRECCKQCWRNASPLGYHSERFWFCKSLTASTCRSQQAHKRWKRSSALHYSKLYRRREVDKSTLECFVDVET